MSYSHKIYSIPYNYLQRNHNYLLLESQWSHFAKFTDQLYFKC